MELEKTARAYIYGCLKPIQGEDVVRQQILLGHRYYNKLIEIERNKRTQYREARTRICPEVAEQEALVAEAEKAAEAEYEEFIKTRVKARAKTPASESYKLARVKLKEARAKLKEARVAAKENEELTEAAKLISESAAAQIKAARAACGVFWGTYSFIEAAVDQAIATSKQQDPQFRRNTGEGRVGLHVKGGYELSEFYAPNRQVYIEPVSEEAWTGPRGNRRRAQRTKLWLRVASQGKNNEPVFAVFPMIYHRPIPEGAKVKAVRMHLRKQGLVEKWLCEVVWTREAAPVVNTNEGAVAVDLGWRLNNHDVRTGFYVTTDKAAGQIVTNGDIIGRIQHSSSLRSIQDKIFDETIRDLHTWFKTHREDRHVTQFLAKISKRRNVPDEEQNIAENIGHFMSGLPKWKSATRLTNFVHNWAENRFTGDNMIFAMVDAWRKQHRHLYQWEINQRVRAMGHRKEQYRIFAAQLANKYKTLIIEDFDITKVARKQAPTDTKFEVQAARTQRVYSAPSILRDTLINAFQTRGGTVVKLPAAYTTQTCHKCGAVEAFDAAHNISHECTTCHSTWDQDENAARNLLKTWQDTQPAQDLAAE